MEVVVLARRSTSPPRAARKSPHVLDSAAAAGECSAPSETPRREPARRLKTCATHANSDGWTRTSLRDGCCDCVPCAWLAHSELSEERKSGNVRS